MNFFSSQDEARRLTRRLTWLFALAVVVIVIAVNVVAGLTLAFDPGAAMVVTILTLVLISGGSLYRIATLREGGTAVAEALGARRVLPSSTDFEERRLLNIVEEMAIASGISVPQVYVMDQESAINAFAAGYSPNEAVVAVTRGTLKALTRDELQGVVAHEFSHILNGDMRINLRMVGLLHGILLISLIGQKLMSSNSSSSSRDRDSIAPVMLGLGLLAIGYIGVFCANLIKAAVSRQREFLADASAVQFTRNPEGIGGALIKIAKSGSLIENANAPELSHMFLGTGVRSAIGGMLATHPSIEERIERVLGKNAARLLERTQSAPMSSSTPEWVMGFGSGTSNSTTQPAPGGQAVQTTIPAVLESVGNPRADHVSYAHALIKHLPPEVRAAIATETGAKAALLALVMGDDAVRASQLKMLADAGETQSGHLAAGLVDPLRALGDSVRLPVVELALSAVKALPSAEHARLTALLRALSFADQKLDAFEFVLLAIVTRQLNDDVGRVRRVKYRSLEDAAAHVAVVVSMFVHTNSGGTLLFDRIVSSINVRGQSLAAPDTLSFERLQEALIELQMLAPLVKPALIKACLLAVMDDGKIAVAEAELMRGVCAMLDSPLPPIMQRAPA